MLIATEPQSDDYPDGSTGCPGAPPPEIGPKWLSATNLRARIERPFSAHQGWEAIGRDIWRPVKGDTNLVYHPGEPMKLRVYTWPLGILTAIAALNLPSFVPAAQTATPAPSDSSTKNGKSSKPADGKKPADARKTADTKKPADAKKTADGTTPADKKPGAAKSAAKACGDSKTATCMKPSAGDQAKKDKTADKAEEKEKEKKPATVTVKKQPFKIDVNLDGVFEADQMYDISVHGLEWIDFEVLKAVPHGTRVKEGDLLVSLDTEKIDRTIADLQREQALARLALRETELQSEANLALAPMDLWQSLRAKRLADEDVDYFNKIDGPFNERMAAFLVKTAENDLAYESEELKQLEKMYKADDLMEDTEEIILKRARDNVERAKFMVERAKIMRDGMTKLTLPRAREMIQYTKDRQEVDAKKARETQPLTLKKLELSLEKVKSETERSEKKLKRLLTDREAMNVKAPAAGIVYYGRCTRGHWSGGEMIAEKLRRGGRITNDDVFMTVVATRPLSIHTTVPEKQLHQVAAGQKAVVTPTGFPDLKLSATLQRVSPVPLGSHEFDAVLTLALDDAAAAPMPGMSCDVKLQAYRKAEALTVPASAVGGDDDDPAKHFVMLQAKGGKAEKHAVTVGRHTAKLVEILHGLHEGDEVLKEYSQDKDKEKDKESDGDS